MAREVTLGPTALRRRVLHRQGDRRRPARPRADRGARRQRAASRPGSCSTRSRRQFPHGLANSSGVVGKYLTDTTGTDVCADLSRARGPAPHNEDGVGGMHIYIAVVARQQEARLPARLPHRDLRRLRACPVRLHGRHRELPDGGGYGAALKDDYRTYYGATIGFSGRGEMIPNADSYCEIDPARGPLGHSGAALPLEVERPRVQPGQAHAGDLPRAHRRRWAARRSSPMPTREQGYGIATGGQIIHELGGVAHGQRPDSVGVNATARPTTAEPLRRRRRARSCPRPTRTPPGRSWRWPCARRDYIAQPRNTGAL